MIKQPKSARWRLFFTHLTSEILVTGTCAVWTPLKTYSLSVFNRMMCSLLSHGEQGKFHQDATGNLEDVGDSICGLDVGVLYCGLGLIRITFFWFFRVRINDYKWFTTLFLNSISSAPVVQSMIYVVCWINNNCTLYWNSRSKTETPVMIKLSGYIYVSKLQPW